MIEIAYSPCPNDTFIFDGWVHQKIDSPITAQPTLADIQTLNRWALAGRFSVTKVSVSCLAHICKTYALLPVGAAIGHFGPKVIAKRAINLDKRCRIAIPGQNSTAFLLFRILFGTRYEFHFCTYDEIVSLIANDVVDAGVIIHETRFTFEQVGLIEIADLGDLFQEQYNCLVPLGVLVAKRTEREQEIIKAISYSIAFAKQNPASANDYVRAHAQEKDPAVIQAHIDAYVTGETSQMSSDGLRSIRTLFELAASQDLLPKTCLEFL